jgi:ribosomal protein S18 acetylase RimI-like enzyme
MFACFFERPWKDAQITYLKTLQTGDLRRRRDKHANSNEMFLAFAAEPALVESPEKPLIMDNGEIQNLPDYLANQPFVRGELLGFVEITQRPYGLGEGPNIGSDRLRPILTNLAVSRRARTLGIGSKLLDRCERHVAGTWRMNEIVLEVEDYNTKALDFYTKRGYEILYSDPASRRFDVSGLVLRKIRCTRQILRKDLTWHIAQIAGEQLAGRSWFSQFVSGRDSFYFK